MNFIEGLLGGAAGGIITFFFGLWKFRYAVSRDTTVRRGDVYEKLRAKFDGDDFDPLYEALDSYDAARKLKGEDPNSKEAERALAVAEDMISKLSTSVRGGFAAFVENVALVTKSGLISYTLANYQFGYYTILCEGCEPFWHDLDKDSEYWALFHKFAKDLEPLAAALKAHPDAEIEKLEF